MARIEHILEGTGWFAEKKSAADYRWLEEVRQTGTSADKLASLSLLIQVKSLCLFQLCTLHCKADIITSIILISHTLYLYN